MTGPWLATTGLNNSTSQQLNMNSVKSLVNNWSSYLDPEGYSILILLTSGRKCDTSCWIMLQLDVLLLQLLLGLLRGLGHLLLVQLLVVSPEWTPPGVVRRSSLTVEVSVVLDWLLAQVAHHGSAPWPRTRHLVAAFFLVVLDLALPTLPHHGLGQLLFNPLPLLLLPLLLHLVTAQGNVVGLLLQ